MTARSNLRSPFLWAPFLLSLAAACLAVALVGPATPHQAAAQGARTRLVWRAKCGSCHGQDGRGQTKQGRKMHVPDFTDAAWQSHQTDDQMRDRIMNGIDETKNGIHKKMDPFRSKLRPAQIRDLIRHIRSLSHH